MPPISVMMKPASGLCNMSCDYCFYADEISKREQQSCQFMSEETLRNIIRRTILRADGMASYVYQGGEPLLRGLDFFRQAVFCQRKYNGNNIRVSNAIQTNGLLLDDDWCRFLKENDFLVGVSVDGTEETHDYYRHTCKSRLGTYGRITENITLLARYGVDFNILTVVNKQTAPKIKQIYEDFKRRGWHYQQYILCLEPLSEERGKTDYALSPEEYGNFLIELFDLWHSDYLLGRQPYIRQFENYVAMLSGYPAESCEQRGSCSIQYVVEANGDTYPCDFYMLDEYLLGNLNQDQLDVFDRRRLEIGFIERSQQLTETCNSCSYYQICRGGCQRHRDNTGHTSAYENHYCESYKMFFAARLWALKEISADITGKSRDN